MKNNQGKVILPAGGNGVEQNFQQKKMTVTFDPAI